MNRQEKIIAHLRKDAFAEQLGVKIAEVKSGYSRVTITVQPNMVNFLGLTHGGVVFSLADMALAAASNSRGQTAVALNIDIGFLKATYAGDQLEAVAQEQHQGGPIALYDIAVTRQPDGELVAKLQAMVYRKKEWFVPPE
ncbi:MAG: hotdog fold thioesterase [Chloroflexota bacterium]